MTLNDKTIHTIEFYTKNSPHNMCRTVIMHHFNMVTFCDLVFDLDLYLV